MAHRLGYQRLCAGSYEAHASTIIKHQGPEPILPIILSVFKARVKKLWFISVAFTSWSNQRCTLTIPVDQVCLNLISEGVLYIAPFDAGGGNSVKLYMADLDPVTGAKTSSCVDLTDPNRELMEILPSSVRKEPVNLLEVARGLVILRECLNTHEEQMGFFKQLAGKGALVVQGLLDHVPGLGPNQAFASEAERHKQKFRSDVLASRMLEVSPPEGMGTIVPLMVSKKRQSDLWVPPSSPRQGNKRGTDFSHDSASNPASPARKPPPTKRHSFGLGNIPQSKSREISRHDLRQYREKVTKNSMGLQGSSEMSGSYNSRQRELPRFSESRGFYRNLSLDLRNRGSKPRRDSNCRWEDSSTRRIVSGPAYNAQYRNESEVGYDRYESELGDFDKHRSGEEEMEWESSEDAGDSPMETNAAPRYRASLNDGELPAAETLSLGPSTGLGSRIDPQHSNRRSVSGLEEEDENYEEEGKNDDDDDDDNDDDDDDEMVRATPRRGYSMSSSTRGRGRGYRRGSRSRSRYPFSRYD
ncbi:hypothetical protein TWF730_009267 [Orbilia blumenaviensis]|uniref:Uncharacterized protein n=1 Tax=Orbilia blumenaviensis TaxID=1796055 RepID=A0AAV9V4D6_9PEZI